MSAPDWEFLNKYSGNANNTHSGMIKHVELEGKVGIVRDEITINGNSLARFIVDNFDLSSHPYHGGYDLRIIIEVPEEEPVVEDEEYEDE